MAALRALSIGLILVFVATAAAGSPDLWRSEGWKTDFGKSLMPLSEIVSGGVGKDQIPSIDQPKFEKAAAISRYGDREPVIELQVGATARAYPLSILTWHEIVNDVVEGRPVAITYCPLCNASNVFDRRLGGQVLDFGTTGKLRKSDLVMYDRQTETWWQQFTGDAIVGRQKGRSLKMIPSRVVAYSDFRKRHPGGDVLVPTDASSRPYGRNPYVAYDSGQTPYALVRCRLPGNINPMARVVIVRRDDAVVAVSLDHLRKKGRVELDDMRISWVEGVASALDRDEISRGREVGAVEAVDAASREMLVADVTFAFVLFAFHPGVLVLTDKGRLTLEAQQPARKQNSRGAF